jgi:uncharacterized membrane protein YbaN (DUF454 family)
MKNMTRILYLTIGTLAVGLAILGMILPLLPTTPFLLLAAVCYARSSSRFYHWLLTNPWFGQYIRYYREGRGIPLKQKIVTLTLLWLTIGYTAFMVVSAWWGQLMLLAIAIGVTLHLLKTKTFKPEPAEPARAETSAREWTSREMLDN